MMASRHRRAASMAAVLGVCLAACACGGSGHTTSPGAPPLDPQGRGITGAVPPALRSVVMPDLSQFEPSVQAQLKNRFDLLTRKKTEGAPAPELALAYGDLGRFLLSARIAEFAEPCFLNAQALAPGDRRWPYYLGHIYKSKGALGLAIASFGRALELNQNDVPTLIWLGDAQLQAGRPDMATTLFSRALASDSGSLAARFGLGRAALAARDFRAAVDHLETALRLEPKAGSAHYPLALAYRGLGDTGRADAHSRLPGGADIAPADPLMDDVRGLLDSAVAYELTGTRALNGGDWRSAIAEFRKGLALEPSSAPLKHKLGTALFISGDVKAARATFEDVVRQTPSYAKAQYSLGVLLADEGRSDEAMARLSAALAQEPNYVEAHVSLAELLRKRGRLVEAVTQYDRALTVDPRLQEAALGRALTLIRLQRYAEAAERLYEARQVHPQAPWLAHALARLLAAAPDDRVRDGRQALVLMEALPQNDQRLDFGETMSMALAEVGRFQDAAAWQRGAIDLARRAGRVEQVARMAERLQLYQSGKPSRRPWRPEELQ